MNPAGFAAPALGTPTPCTVCGAPMALTQPPALHQNPELWCHFCGHREGLPADSAELHRHVRLRLLQLTRAREAAEAPLRTFKAMGDLWPIAILFSGALGAFQSWTFVSSWQQYGRVDLAQAMMGALPLAVSFGMLSGWLGMKSAFARQLRPLLRARPPQQPGLAVRCRNCGGDLPSVRAPEVTCGYCGASNVLDATLTVNAAALLQAERQEYERRMLPWARDPAVYLAPTRAFYRFGSLGGGVALLVIGAVMLLITH